MSINRMETTRQYLLVLEQHSLCFVDHVELVEAGLLDVETLMPTAKAHAFIDNTHDTKRWMKVISEADSLQEAVLLAEQYARKDIGLI